MRSPLIIGTRGSDLALWQANHIKDLLEENGLSCELKIIKTQGDHIQDVSLEKLEGKGFFTKEIEDALLSGETDIAVHSHKDLPTESSNELMIAAVTEREDPSELLIIRKEALDSKQKFSLKRNAVVGTSSSRRKSQLLAFRPDCKPLDLRGNVPTRIQKLRDKNYDAILIAAAGVERLDLDITDFHSEKLDPAEFIPAPAQGVLAVQVRNSDKELISKLKGIDRPDVREVINIERKVLSIFHGGCHMPVGVYAKYDDDSELFEVRVSKSSSWDKLPVSVYSQSSDPNGLAERLVEKINSIKPCSVFITRNIHHDSFLRNVLGANGFSISGKALIDIVPVSFGNVPDSEWIFFSSKHAVNYFFGQKPVTGDRKYACVGKSTAEALRKFGKRADFIGSSTDTKMTGKQFAARAGRAKVLFPQAKGSMRSIQDQIIKGEQIINLVVYETLKKNEGAQPVADILAFTSPSNVEAWFEKYRISKQQKLIAFGDATANELRKAGFPSASKPDSFDEAGLARAIFGMSGKE